MIPPRSRATGCVPATTKPHQNSGTGSATFGAQGLSSPLLSVSPLSSLLYAHPVYFLVSPPNVCGARGGGRYGDWWRILHLTLYDEARRRYVAGTKGGRF